jgi:hypothetical protein
LDEGLGRLIVFVQVAVDRSLEPDTALRPPSCQRGEGGFNRAGSRGGGRREVEGSARVAGDPSADLLGASAREELVSAGTAAAMRLRKRVSSWCEDAPCTDQ